MLQLISRVDEYVSDHDYLLPKSVSIHREYLRLWFKVEWWIIVMTNIVRKINHLTSNTKHVILQKAILSFLYTWLQQYAFIVFFVWSVFFVSF